MSNPNDRRDRASDLEALKELANEPATESPETLERGADLIEEPETTTEETSQQQIEEK